MQNEVAEMQSMSKNKKSEEERILETAFCLINKGKNSQTNEHGYIAANDCEEQNSSTST